MKSFIKKFNGLDAAYISGFERLRSSDEFYSRIKTLLSSADTAYIASLFFGDDGRMVEILDILEERKMKGLQTMIFIDKNRGHGLKGLGFARDRGLTSMFHLIDFSRSRFLPRRINEVLRVFHTKALVFDDTILVSGANMDSSYMDNRIDRYFEIESSELASLIRSRIFDIKPHGRIQDSNQNLPIYVGMFKELQEPFVVKALVEEDFEEVHISTGYLNFPNSYLDMFNGRRISLYASCPDADTFNAFGPLSRIVGPVYSYSFCRTLEYAPTLSMHEFIKNGHTFHSKGIWGFKNGWAATVVGSSNFNRRSVERDDETNYLIITSEPRYVKELRSEVEYLRNNSKERSSSELMKKRYGIVVVLFFLIFSRFL